MRALALNATLKPAPQPSSTEALTRVVLDALEAQSVECEIVRLVDLDIAPGVVSEAIRAGDEWPALHRKVLAADIVIMATPTWFGRPSSVISKALERMDALLSETDDSGVPSRRCSYARFVVTGNEDGPPPCCRRPASSRSMPARAR